MSGSRKFLSILLVAVIVGALTLFHVTNNDSFTCDTSKHERPSTNYNVEITYTPEGGSKISSYEGCGEWSTVVDDKYLVWEGDELNPELKLHLDSETEMLEYAVVYYGDGSSRAAWVHQWDGQDQVTPRRSFRITKEDKTRVKLTSVHVLIHKAGGPFPSPQPGKGLCSTQVFADC